MGTRLLLNQRDLLTTYKRETCSNVSILSKIHPLPNDLSKQIFKEEPLEKPTQHMFIDLSYYLVCIIDPQKAASFTWPLYDSKAEKTYRNELSAFIAGYVKSGALAPVLSSYFVNPGCFKVIKLMFQLSTLAVQQALKAKMQKDSQKNLHSIADEKFKTGNKDFLDYIERETEIMNRKLQNHQRKKQIMTNASEMLKKKIVENEEWLAAIRKQKFLSDLVDDFVQRNSLEKDMEIEVQKIKNEKESVPMFESWLQHVDEQIARMESEWNDRITPFLETTKYCHKTSEALILRHTGEMDKKTYMVEYNPKVDEISTKELESQVNPNQKYILKNIIKHDELNFPNLIRGFVVSISYLLRNDMGDDIYQFNQYLEVQRRNFGEISSAMDVLLERVMEGYAQLQTSPVNINDQSISIVSEIPPLPDLTDLKATQTLLYKGIHDVLTPLNLSKHRFNLRRNVSVPTMIFAKPPPRPLTTPFHTSRDAFLRGLNSCRTNLSDRPKLNMSQNISIISQPGNRCNETIVECSSGFTKQQIQRLLSTKKTSSSKKHKFNPERPKMVIKKGRLFNDSVESTLIRSHSSPNLYENKEKRPASKRPGRQLSIMQEDASSILEVSGIIALDSPADSAYETPKQLAYDTISPSNLLTIATTTSMPTIIVSPVQSVRHLSGNYISRYETPNLISNVSPTNVLSGATSMPTITVNPVQSSCCSSGKNAQEDDNGERQNTLEELKKVSVDNNTKCKERKHWVVHKSGESQIPVKINAQSLQRIDRILKETEDLNHKVNRIEKLEDKSARKSTDSTTSNDDCSVTPKSNIPVRKTSSIEKLIHRFKRVRGPGNSECREDTENSFKTIAEEKENCPSAVNVDLFTAKKVLLPDLLGPSCSGVTKKSTDFIDTIACCLDDVRPTKKSRESLGAMLGVDQTVLKDFTLME